MPPALPAAFPNSTVLDLEGQPVTLASLYREQTQILCFLRHFG
jgi:hypothetical protein